MSRALFAVLLSLFLLASCAQDDSGKNDDGRVSANNFKGGACGSNIISDYNDVVLTCRYINSDLDATDCKNTAQSFVSKYPDINCRAEKLSDSSVDDDIVFITSSDFKDLIAALEEAGY